MNTIKNTLLLFLTFLIFNTSEAIVCNDDGGGPQRQIEEINDLIKNNQLNEKQLVELEKQLVGLEKELGGTELKGLVACGGGGGGNNETRTVTVTCESQNFDEEPCLLPNDIINVSVVSQLSDASCGGHFNWSGPLLTVDSGCRAVFSVFLTDAVTVQNFNCSSYDLQFENCPALQANPVWIKQRLSAVRCKFGFDWSFGFGDGWVDHGCRATFSTAY